MLVEEAVLSVGAHIAYWQVRTLLCCSVCHYAAHVDTQNDVKLLLHDARAARPALFAAVPRVLERVVSETKSTLATKPALIRRVFNWAVEKKIQRMYRTGNVKKVCGLHLWARRLLLSFGTCTVFLVR